MRELVYYVATSLDGWIADPDGDFSAFLNDPATLGSLFERYPETCPAHLRDALGVTGPARRFDTVLMGYRTYQPARDAGLRGGAYPHLRQIVATHRDLPSGPEVISGDLASEVATLKAQPGADIWLCGGADLAGQVIDLIDEIQVKINPVTLASGTPLLASQPTPRVYTLTQADILPGGVILATYRSGHPPSANALYSTESYRHEPVQVDGWCSAPLGPGGQARLTPRT